MEEDHSLTVLCVLTERLRGIKHNMFARNVTSQCVYILVLRDIITLVNYKVTCTKETAPVNKQFW